MSRLLEKKVTGQTSDPLDEYAGRDDLYTRENANKYMGPTGFVSYIAERALSIYERRIIPHSIYRAHLDGYIYIHKLPLSLYIPYCTGHSIQRLLKKGLITTTIVSRPARHMDTYVDHIANYLVTLQHYFTGAQAFSSVEWYSGPFIRRDNVDYTGVRQHIQRLVFNLNYPSRTGMQTPFTNFTVTLDAPRKMLEGDHAVYEGRDAGPLGTYYDEARMFFLALIDVLRHGDMYGQPFTFPIPTLMATAKMIWEDPEVHEAVFQTAARRGSFYWLNTRVVDPDASYAMCLHGDELIIYRVGGRVVVESIKEMFQRHHGAREVVDPDGAEWYSVNGDIEVLSYDPSIDAIAWRRVKRFLVKRYSEAVVVKAIDGKQFIVSPDHPVMVKINEDRRIVEAQSLVTLIHKTMVLIPVVSSKIETSEGAANEGIDEDVAYLLGLYYGAGTLVEAVQALPLPGGSGGQVSTLIVFPETFILELQSHAARLGCGVENRDGKAVVYGCDGIVAMVKRSRRGLPEELWNSSLRIRERFLEGLIRSGHPEGDVFVVRLRDEDVAKEIALLASITGFEARLEGTKLILRRSGEVHGDTAWVPIAEAYPIHVDDVFIDVEVDGPHYFVHSMGVITHNCCRINIDMNELRYAYSRPRGLGLNFSLKKDIERQREEVLRKIEEQRFGGLWAMPDITGSINVTTVNLPRIAIESRGDDAAFWELYSRVLGIVRRSEEWFRERYLKLMEKYPGMYTMISLYLKEFPSSHFNTIGILGLPEAAAIMMGDPRLWEEGSRRDWLRAADLMKNMVEYAVKHAREWMRETGVPWNVEEVPGESAAAKLALKDVRLYPEIKEYLYDPENPIYSTSIAPYYGSLELPDRILIESRVQKSFTGGVMMHIFLGEEPDPEALAKLTKRLIETDLVYWSYTPAITHCNSCGSTFTGLYTRCPRCGSTDVEVWSRIIGYYRPLRNWNPYRRKEFWSRRHYGVGQ